MQMNTQLNISQADIKRLVEYCQAEIINQMDQRIRTSAAPIYNMLYSYIDTALDNAPEVNALFRDTLRFDLGLRPEWVPQVIDDIKEALKDDLRIRTQKNKDSLEVTLVLIPNDYRKFLSIPNAEYESINRDLLVTRVPWLEWLLLRGHDQVVQGYHVKYVPYNNPRSRSGGAFMIKTGTYNVIPSQYTGTAGDNFITRSLDNIGEILRAELFRVLS